MSRKRLFGGPADAHDKSADAVGDLFDPLRLADSGEEPQAPTLGSPGAPQRFLRPNPSPQSDLFAAAGALAARPDQVAVPAQGQGTEDAATDAMGAAPRPRAEAEPVRFLAAPPPVALPLAGARAASGAAHAPVGLFDAAPAAVPAPVPVPRLAPRLAPRPPVLAPETPMSHAPDLDEPPVLPPLRDPMPEAAWPSPEQDWLPPDALAPDDAAGAMAPAWSEDELASLADRHAQGWPGEPVDAEFPPDFGDSPHDWAPMLPQRDARLPLAADDWGDEDDDDGGEPIAPPAAKAEPAADPAAAEADAASEPSWAQLPEANWQAPDALARLQQHLKAWQAHGQLRALDVALAGFLVELDPRMPVLALLGAVLASHQLGRGHVCLDLPQVLKYGARALAWRRVVLPEPTTAKPEPQGVGAGDVQEAGGAEPAARLDSGDASVEAVMADAMGAWADEAPADLDMDAHLPPLAAWSAFDAPMDAGQPPEWPGDWPEAGGEVGAGGEAGEDERDWPALGDAITDADAAAPATLDGHSAVAVGVAAGAHGEADAVPLPAEDADTPELLLPAPMDWLQGVRLSDWQAQLALSPLVQAGAGRSPLVLSGPRLYLRREWQDEQVVRAAITARMAQAGSMRGHLSTEQWRDALDALFGPPRPSAPATADMDWQKAACALAASQGFCIITGGPGTGKTTTVVKLLALLQGVSLAQAQGRTLRIELAAPTGKAAARLGDSIRDALGQLQLKQLADTLGLHAPAQAESAAGSAGGAALGEGHAPGMGNAAVAAAGPAPVPESASAPSPEQVLRQGIPTQARTLHRLLGSQPESRHFRHNARNPLPLDVLVVDEASMVDLDMMARLLHALPAHARLVLLGDKDQLSSVEAGAVLGELCSRANQGHFLPDTAQWLHSVTGQRVPGALQDAHGTPLDQAVVMLRHSHRFDGESGIGQLASVVNAGDLHGLERLRQQPLADLHWLRIEDTRQAEFAQLVRDGAPWPQGDAAARPPAADAVPQTAASAGQAGRFHGHAHYLRVMAEGEAQWRRAHAAAGQLHAPSPVDEGALARWALDVLDAQRQFQLLCALREGPWGVTGLNRRITQVLAEARLVQPQGEWWAGRPVMVTGNDYGLGLMNGDVGVTLQRPDRLAVAFPAIDRPGGVRWVAPSRLNQVETVFAMTVHKSQGSEFAHTAVLVPPSWNPVLTRELLYTGITRAKRCCSLVLAGAQSDQVLALTVRRRVLRASGLLSENGGASG